MVAENVAGEGVYCSKWRGKRKEREAGGDLRVIRGKGKGIGILLLDIVLLLDMGEAR